MTDPVVRGDRGSVPAAGPVAVLVNPRAGRRRAGDLRAAVTAALGSSGRPIRLLDTADRASAERACHAAVAGGAAALIAVGGDGTVHLALQAVAGRPVALGIVPTGTGNDIATELGLPTEPITAARAAGAALALSRTRAIDLALVETARGGTPRWFAGVLAAGFDARVNHLANRMVLPRGPRRYDLAVLAELALLRRLPYRVRIDDVESRLDAVLVCVGNTAAYGGGMRICPGADPADGLLDVLVGARVGRTTLIRLKRQVRAGTHVRHPQVRQARGVRVELDCPGITAYADGEPVSPLPITVTCVPEALTLLDPR